MNPLDARSHGLLELGKHIPQGNKLHDSDSKWQEAHKDNKNRTRWVYLGNTDIVQGSKCHLDIVPATYFKLW